MRIDLSSLTDISVDGVAERIELQLQHRFGVAHDVGSFWLYQRAMGIWRRCPNWLMEQVVGLFHHRTTVNMHAECERRGKGPKPSECFQANPTTINAALKRLSTRLQEHHRSPAEGSLFDRTTALASFTNGTLRFDPATRKTELVPHAPEHFSRHAYDFDFQLGQEPSWLLRVLREDVFGGLGPDERELRIEVLRLFAGHALLGSQHLSGIHTALFLLGAGGDGKSVFLDLVRNCAAPGSCAAVQPQDLTGGAGFDAKSAAAALQGITVNIVEDVSSSQLGAGGALKTMISFGVVRARQIGHDEFSFRARATMLFSGNALPPTSDRTRGFARRWRVVEFPRSIDARHFDPKLGAKLYSLERAEFVCWAAQAALRQLQTGEPMPTPACHTRLLGKWLAGDDPIAEFFRYRTKPAGEDKTSWTPIADLFGAYSQWMTEVHGPNAARRLASTTAFSARLKELGAKSDRRGKGNTRVVSLLAKACDEA